ncbi:cell division protein FtsW [Diaminobutyricibacter tongyongensis]|uniref:Probable peptidoglycan glycosyltransferase FtsW n=2 Tax=Leifsonia tongyongensis TaxID=1268043 RepID=A0A6L9XTI1_9MICO|nr:cell division protein FtsW [Diaminobutyricibacter tongyongensis]
MAFMLVASRLPVKFWKRWAWQLLLATALLQILVVASPLGVRINGNRNWLQISGVPTIQPSEAIKVAVAVWLGTFVATKIQNVQHWRRFLLPASIVTGSAIALVTVGGDLGTTMILAAMVLGALYFARTPLKQLALTAAVEIGIALLVALSRANRVTRILSFLHPAAADPTGSGWQVLNGDYALASGGVFGVGLGNSHAKWDWLPAADTDFIFAIIGEELGLIGAATVLALFVLLALVFVRIIRRSTDVFVITVTGAIMVWIIAEAFVNIAVVLGMLPVLGVPLPFISSGGTALVSTLIAIGIVLSFARDQNRPGQLGATATRAH